MIDLLFRRLVRTLKWQKTVSGAIVNFLSDLTLVPSGLFYFANIIISAAIYDLKTAIF